MGEFVEKFTENWSTFVFLLFLSAWLTYTEIDNKYQLTFQNQQQKRIEKNLKYRNYLVSSIVDLVIMDFADIGDILSKLFLIQN